MTSILPSKASLGLNAFVTQRTRRLLAVAEQSSSPCHVTHRWQTARGAALAAVVEDPRNGHMSMTLREEDDDGE